MRIGLDAIGIEIGQDALTGEGEHCVMAIGIQPVGNVVVRDVRTGRFTSLTRARSFGRMTIGAYTEVEPAEFESRPLARAPRTSTVAARAVLALMLVVVARAVDADATVLAVAVGRAADATGDLARATVDGVRWLARWGAGYVRREFLAQWRLGLATLVPCAAVLAWVMMAAR